MTDDEVCEWVDKRQEFRALMLVQIAELPKDNRYADHTVSEV